MAEDAGYIALPRACGDAALIASYAMLKCEALRSSVLAGQSPHASAAGVSQEVSVAGL